MDGIEQKTDNVNVTATNKYEFTLTGSGSSEHTVQTVSYTHLDVYKRQVYCVLRRSKDVANAGDLFAAASGDHPCESGKRYL